MFQIYNYLYNNYHFTNYIISKDSLQFTHIIDNNYYIIFTIKTHPSFNCKTLFFKPHFNSNLNLNIQLLKEKLGINIIDNISFEFNTFFIHPCQFNTLKPELTDWINICLISLNVIPSIKI